MQQIFICGMRVGFTQVPFNRMRKFSELEASSESNEHVAKRRSRDEGVATVPQRYVPECPLASFCSLTSLSKPSHEFQKGKTGDIDCLNQI
jgi:hypothetical protein